MDMPRYSSVAAMIRSFSCRDPARFFENWKGRAFPPDIQSPVHPGEFLREDFLVALGLSEYRVAKDIGMPPRRTNEIVKGKRAVTADTAVRLEPSSAGQPKCGSTSSPIMTSNSSRKRCYPCWRPSIPARRCDLLVKATEQMKSSAQMVPRGRVFALRMAIAWSRCGRASS